MLYVEPRLRYIELEPPNVTERDSLNFAKTKHMSFLNLYRHECILVKRNMRIRRIRHPKFHLVVNKVLVHLKFRSYICFPVIDSDSTLAQ